MGCHDALDGGSRAEVRSPCPGAVTMRLPRHVPKTKRSQPRLDLDTSRELRNDKAKFYRAIGAKLFLVQKGWIKLLLKASLAFNRDDYYDQMVGSMRAAGALELQSPAFGGSAPFGEAMFVIWMGGLLSILKGFFGAHQLPWFWSASVTWERVVTM